MTFQIKSHIEDQPKGLSESDAYSSQKVSSWVHEKGYFTQKHILDEVDRRLRDVQKWPGNGKFAQATFDRISKEGGRGISTNKFIAEFDGVIDTKLDGVREALNAIEKLIVFFGHFPFEVRNDDADGTLDYSSFLRAMSIHAEINPLFNIDLPQLKTATRDGQDGHKVGTDPLKTLADIRRLLFRGFADSLPQSEEITSRTRLPVLQFIRHEHQQAADGKSVNIEYRVFELEDERTIELQDMLAMSKTRTINTRLIAPFSRGDFREAMVKLPVFKHDLQQLGISKETLVSLISLLSTINPQKPGFQTLPGGEGSFETQYSHWENALAGTADPVRYEDFDQLLKTKLPNFYLQLSKLIGLLVVERSADGGYAGETDPEEVELPPADVMQHRLRMFTASERFDRRKLEENFLVNAADVTKPLYGGCVKCWNLGLVEDEDECLTV